MTRVMFWNVQQFSINKIANPSAKRQNGAGRKPRAVASAERLELMLGLVEAAEPDIFVVIELLGGGGAPGTLPNANGTLAVETLLEALRAENDPAWCLVPPLRSAGKEFVAVFYRSTSLIFSGPYLWPGGGVGPALANGWTGPYAAPFNGMVGARRVPAGSGHNPRAEENQCAAQTRGWNGVGGAPRPQFSPRPPYLTTFAEINGLGQFVRDIAIFSIHAPASRNAGPYMAQLALAREIVGPPAGEVRVVGGDFNLNLLTAAGALNGEYGPLLGVPNPFELGLEPPGPANYTAVARGYYATLIKSRHRAAFWPPLDADYPGYGYIGDDRLNNLFAIDNIFVRGGGNARFTILNPVVGTPFTMRPGPGGYPRPVGTIPVERRAGLPPPPPPLLPQPPPPLPGGGVNLFRGWNNYGRIRSLSDHLPIAMDV